MYVKLCICNLKWLTIHCSVINYFVFIITIILIYENLNYIQIILYFIKLFYALHLVKLFQTNFQIIVLNVIYFYTFSSLQCSFVNPVRSYLLTKKQEKYHLKHKNL